MDRKNKVNVRELMKEYQEHYRRLYYIACAVAGNDRAAERALVNIMISSAAVEAEKAIVPAAKQARHEMGGETTFDCLLGEEEADALSDRLACLPEEARRAVMLRFGLRLSLAEIAEIMRVPAGKVRRFLSQAQAEAAKCACGGDREKAIVRLCQKEMEENELAPDFNTLLRAAEKQLDTAPEPRKRGLHLRQTANWATAVAMMLIVGMLIWCCAVLLDYYRQTQNVASGSRVGLGNWISEDDNARV